MEKMINSVSSYISDRLSNPFISALLTSWVVFNWKPILFVILSSKDIEYKIVYITLYFSDCINVIVLPLIFALIYLLIVPLVNKRIEKLLKENNNEREEIDFDQKEKKAENLKKLAIINAETEKAVTDAKQGANDNELIDTLNSKIEILQKSLNDKEKEITNILHDKANIETELSQEISDMQSNNAHVFAVWQDEKQKLVDEIEAIKKERDNFHEAENIAFGKYAELHDAYQELQNKFNAK